MTGRRRYPRSGSNTGSQQTTDLQDTIYSVGQFAQLIGLSKWAVLKRIQRGQLPAHKNGRCWYLLKSEIVALLRAT